MGGFLTQLPLKKSGIECVILLFGTASPFAMPTRQHAIFYPSSARAARDFLEFGHFRAENPQHFWRKVSGGGSSQGSAASFLATQGQIARAVVSFNAEVSYNGGGAV